MLRVRLPQSKLEWATIMYLCLIPCIAISSIFVPSFIPRRVLFGIIIWLLVCMSGLKKGNIFDSFLLLVIVGIIFGITIWYHPEYNEVYSNRVFHSILSGVSGISGYIIVRQNLNIDGFKRCLKYSAYILFLYYFFRSFEVIKTGVWSNFSVGTASNVFTNSSMEFGYSMLFPALLFMYFYLRDKRLRYLVISLVGLVEIILYGGRGPILAYLCFVALYVVFVWMRSNDIRYKALKIIGILLVVLLAYIFFDDLLGIIVNVLEKAGIQSRVLTLLLKGEATADNGRNLLYVSAWEKITDHSLWSGYGPLSDMFYLDGYYVHNIILELMLDFGMLPGLCLFIVLILGLIRTLLKCIDEEAIAILLIFVSCGFVKLFISSSFWTETSFWMMLALMINFRKLKLIKTTRGK